MEQNDSSSQFSFDWAIKKAKLAYEKLVQLNKLCGLTTFIISQTRIKLIGLLLKLKTKVCNVTACLEEKAQGFKGQDINMHMTASKLKSYFSSITSCVTWTQAVVYTSAIALGLSYTGIISAGLISWLTGLAIAGFSFLLLKHAISSFCKSKQKKTQLQKAVEMTEKAIQQIEIMQNMLENLPSNIQDLKKWQKQMEKAQKEAQKEAQSSQENITKLQEKIDSLEISWLEQKLGCLTLKTKLQNLLSQLLLELRKVKILLKQNFNYNLYNQTQKAERILNSLKRFKRFKKLLKWVIGICATATIIAATGLGVVVGAAVLRVAGAQAAQFAAVRFFVSIASVSPYIPGIGLLIGLAIYGYKQWSESTHNKEMFQDAISLLELTLQQVRDLS